jgi:hypothetical protein
MTDLWLLIPDHCPQAPIPFLLPQRCTTSGSLLANPALFTTFKATQRRFEIRKVQISANLCSPGAEGAAEHGPAHPAPHHHPIQPHEIPKVAKNGATALDIVS